MNPENYPALCQFLGGYFHEDFILEYRDAEGAISAFLADEPPERISLSLEELNHLLHTGMSEQEAASALQMLGSVYDPTVRGKSKLEWLRHLRDRLATRAH